MSRQDYIILARFLAQLLDRSVRIPGTDIRVGLDPLIGLIPGIGDAVASLAGSMILFLAAHLQAPKIVLARMSVNIALNGILGTIPLVGDVFSVWFQSNVRNVALLERHIATSGRQSTFGDWAFVLGLVFVIMSLFAGMLMTAVWLANMVWHGLS